MTGLTARIRNAEGWPVPEAVLTVTDLSGRQTARAVADATGGSGHRAAAPGRAYRGVHRRRVSAGGADRSDLLGGNGCAR